MGKDSTGKYTLIETARKSKELRVDSSGQHHKILHAETGALMVTVPKTPSDHRSMKNCESDMRKQAKTFGVTWPPVIKKGLGPAGIRHGRLTVEEKRQVDEIAARILPDLARVKDVREAYRYLRDQVATEIPGTTGASFSRVTTKLLKGDGYVQVVWLEAIEKFMPGALLRVPAPSVEEEKPKTYPNMQVERDAQKLDRVYTSHPDVEIFAWAQEACKRNEVPFLWTSSNGFGQWLYRVNHRRSLSPEECKVLAVLAVSEWFDFTVEPEPRVAPYPETVVFETEAVVNGQPPLSEQALIMMLTGVLVPEDRKVALLISAEIAALEAAAK